MSSDGGRREPGDRKAAKKPRIMFCPADGSAARSKQYAVLERSLRRFHSEEELPLIRVDCSDRDPLFWGRKTPVTAHPLAREYEVVIGIDVDGIVTGPLDELWAPGDWDVKTVLNDPTYPIAVWDIGGGTGTPYYNGGLIVMREGRFLDHFHRLSRTEHIHRYRYWEQDILNILCSDYFDYTTVCLDRGGHVYGESAKPLWAQSRVENGRILIQEKQLHIIHFAGGPTAEKGDYRSRFPEEVSRFIDSLLR
jgi:hypothetical protein